MIMIKGLPFSTSVDLSSTFFIQHLLMTYHDHKIHQNQKVFPFQLLMKILSLSMASSSHDTAGCADDHDNDDDADVYSFFNFYLNSRPGGLNLLSLWWPAESLRARQHRISRPGVVPSFKSTLFFSVQRQRQTHGTSENTNENTNIKICMSEISRPGWSLQVNPFFLCADPKMNT